MWPTISCIAMSLSALVFHPSVLGQQSKSDEENDIREAIVRYQVKNWDLAAGVYFLEIQSKDPSAAFLHRFDDLPKPVKGKSDAKEKKDIVGFHVEDRRTKKRGVIFDQGTINHLDDSSVEVEGGYVCASLCMASGIYQLRRKDGRWEVTDFTVHIQS